MTNVKNRPFEAAIPASGRAMDFLDGADFHDPWGVEAQTRGRSALGLLIHAVACTPRWVDICRDLRNRAGALVGLKNLGRLGSVSNSKSAEEYQPGKRVGIFTVFENSFAEAFQSVADMIRAALDAPDATNADGSAPYLASMGTH